MQRSVSMPSAWADVDQHGKVSAVIIYYFCLNSNFLFVLVFSGLFAATVELWNRILLYLQGR